MTTYRIARTANNGRTITARYDFEGATLGEAFEAARVWWHLSSTKGLRCLGVVLAPLPQRETVTPQGKRQPDLTGDIIAYESGDLGDLETLELFQHLVDTGLAWQLQGSYGRAARDMIEMGLINDTHGMLAHA